MTSSVVEFDKVSFELDGRRIIRDIDWTIRSGENWVILGPNGAGKTTLLRLLNGYFWPTSGMIAVLGRPFGTVDLRDLRTEIGFVSTYIADWIPDDEKVVDVVVSGKYASIGMRGEPSPSDRARARRTIRRFWDGQPAERRFGQLSQGEKQRVLIARALMAEPRIIALDEPCAGLDLQAREGFLRAIAKIARRRVPSLVYVTQRIEEIPRGFTHTLLLKNGKVVAKGVIDDVVTDGYLSKCFGVKVRVAKWRGRYYALMKAS